MKNNRQRIFSFLLIFLMILSTMPVQSMADTKVTFQDLLANKKLMYYNTYIVNGASYKVYVIAKVPGGLQINNKKFVSGAEESPYNYVIYRNAVYLDDKGNVVKNKELITKLNEVHNFNAVFNSSKLQNRIDIIQTFLDCITKYEAVKTYCDLLGVAGGTFLGNTNALRGYIEGKGKELLVGICNADYLMMATSYANARAAIDLYNSALKIYDGKSNYDYAYVAKATKDLDDATLYDDCSYKVMEKYQLGEIYNIKWYTLYVRTFSSFINGGLDDKGYLKTGLSNEDKDKISKLKDLGKEILSSNTNPNKDTVIIDVVKESVKEAKQFKDRANKVSKLISQIKQIRDYNIAIHGDSLDKRTRLIFRDSSYLLSTLIK